MATLVEAGVTMRIWGKDNIGENQRMNIRSACRRTRRAGCPMKGWAPGNSSAHTDGEETPTKAGERSQGIQLTLERNCEGGL